jgi:hypothetical protein
MITGGCSSPESLRRAYPAAAGRSSLVMAASMRHHPYPDASGLMHRLGRRPPAEAEADYYAHNRDGQSAVHT